MSWSPDKPTEPGWWWAARISPTNHPWPIEAGKAYCTRIGPKYGGPSEPLGVWNDGVWHPLSACAPSLWTKATPPPLPGESPS